MLFEFGNPEPVELTRKEQKRLQSDLSFMTQQQHDDVRAEINHRLDDLFNIPAPIGDQPPIRRLKGGKVNPLTGIAGDWTGHATGTHL
jgi:hypothetical protein